MHRPKEEMHIRGITERLSQVEIKAVEHKKDVVMLIFLLQCLLHKERST